MDTIQVVKGRRYRRVTEEQIERLRAAGIDILDQPVTWMSGTFYWDEGPVFKLVKGASVSTKEVA